MHIVDAIKALKGGLEAEEKGHLITMTERDEARDMVAIVKDERDIARNALQPTEEALTAAKAELAAAATELGVEYPAAEEAPAKGK